MADDKPSPYPQQQPPPGAQYPPPAYGGPTQPAYPPPAPPGYPGSVAQPGGYPGAATTTTIIQQPTAVAISTIGFGESPVAMSCPNCKMSIVTATSYVTGTLTWLACLGLCVVGCDLGCCLIPFCCDPMKDVVHLCPSCGAQVGVFRRM